MYIENLEIPKQEVEPLVFAKYLLGEEESIKTSTIPQSRPVPRRWLILRGKNA